MSEEMQFTDRTVMVTGAAGNLGRAVAQAFADLGASLVLVVKKGDLQDGERRLVLSANLLDQESVREAVEKALQRFKRIDVLCNLAGAFRMGQPVHEISDDDWNFLFDVNARTVLNTARAVVPVMLKAGGGKIVNVGGVCRAEGRRPDGRLRGIEKRRDPPHGNDGRGAARKEHQRQLRAAYDHRYAREPRCHAANRPAPLGRAGGSRPRDRISGVRLRACDPWRCAARHGAELIFRCGVKERPSHVE